MIVFLIENFEMRYSFYNVVQMHVYHCRTFALDSIAAVHKAPKYGAKVPAISYHLHMASCILRNIDKMI